MLKIISLSTKHKAIAWIKILILTYKSWSSIRGGIRRNLSLVLTNGDIIQFNDGKENILDFKDFITKSQHPDIKKYEDKNLFKKFNLEYGELQWNDYDLAFPVYDLYKGTI